MSLEKLPDGQLAALVTYLEMHEPPAEPVPRGSLQLRRARLDADSYRALFRKVGAPWLWFSRLVMTDDQLEAIIAHPGVELFEVVAVEAVVGMLELDFRVAGECEIAFVGLVPELSGQGHGRWLLAEAVHRAWRDGVRRVHVHTCSLDHPAALAAYRRAGFAPVRRALERFTDPRLTGALPADAAPQVPLLGTDTAA
ncbi:MAG TPA: GNAT family N-acetyltransferase [Sphingomicrobium sp.]|jgi:GNAT superfamily N-acetyltransferase|nr:GNAT family N-acetyltransferase [Sphingomicrobium sp.]